jgi:DNA-binding winged helix-turn-helix (wHTH) protein/Tol biopolymer transport system component
MDETVRFGRFRVSTARRELWRDDEPVKIGRRALDLLVALLATPGALVTKDELAARVWGSAAVEDNAIAAQIATLRRILGEGAGETRYIQTVPGRGYRFVAALHAADEADHDPAPAATAPDRRIARSRGPWPVAALVVAGIVTAASAGWLVSRRGWQIDRMDPVAETALVATQAAPSPNGAMLAYAAGPERDHRRVFLRSLTGGEPTAFTRGEGDESAPAWSPASDRIAFVRGGAGLPCAILVKPVLAGDERQVGRCRSLPATSLAWSADGAALFYHDRPAPEAASRIVRLDVATGVPADVTRPPPGSDGDVTPEVSPNGRRLVFQRATDVLTAVFVHDLATGAERQITPRDLNVAGADWIDDRTLIVATNPPDLSALWSYPADGGRRRRLTLSPAEFQHLVSNHAGLVGFESHTYRNALAYGGDTASASPPPVEDVSGLVNGLNVSPDGAIVFARAPRGWGPWDIWLKRPGRPAQPLTTLQASYAEGPRWSPDRRLVAFSATVGRSAAIYVVQTDGSALRRLTSASAPIAGPAWAPDGRRLVYPRLGRDGWRLWEVAIDAPGRERPRPERGWVTVRSEGGDLYGLALKGGLWRLGSRPALIAAGIGPQHSMDWDVGDGRLTFIDRSSPGAPRLVVVPLTGEPRRTFAAPRPLADDPADTAGVIGGAGFDPVVARPVYVQATGGEIQVGVLRLVRR